MAESYVQVSEGTGKKLHSVTTVIGSDTVHDEVVKFGENYLAGYTVVGSASAGTANDHLLQIMAGSSLKVRVRRIEIHQATAATTGVITDFKLFRLSTAGTGGGAVTPNPLDPSDAAFSGATQTRPTAKGTEGAQMGEANAYAIQTVGASTPFGNPLVVWDFDRPRSKPLIIPAGTANGLAVKNNAAYAGLTVVVLAWIDESNF